MAVRENRSAAAVWAVSNGSAANCYSQPGMEEITIGLSGGFLLPGTPRTAGIRSVARSVQPRFSFVNSGR
jgi:hypothetical protein